VTNTLANPLTVQVTDEFGNPVEGESISFAITDEPSGATGQSLSATTVLTAADGLASSTLTTGNVSGDYSVTASGTGIGPVVFTAGQCGCGVDLLVRYHHLTTNGGFRIYDLTNRTG
jgi:hypothetical protein